MTGGNMGGGNTTGGNTTGGNMGGGMDYDSSLSITINGGTLTINAQGDGIDSNGDIYINGGEVYVNGPTQNDNSALDPGGSIYLNGGTVIASGSSGMVETPSTTSGQASLVYYYTNTQTAGSTITLKDSSGNTIATCENPKTYSCVIISTPAMTDGQTYSLYSGDTKLEDITLSGTVTSSGTASSTGMSGGFGQNKSGGR